MAGREHPLPHPPVEGAQTVEFQAETPSLAGLAPGRAVLAESAHSAGPPTVTDRQGLGVQQVEGGAPSWNLPGG
jgi:hypothetical protein